MVAHPGSDEGREMDHDVAWLLARANIRELTARYNRCFDSGDADGFAATFVEDGVMEIAGGPSYAGREALAEMCRRTPSGIMHVTVDATVEVAGTHATQLVNVLVLGRPASRSTRPDLRSTGHYVDDLVRTEEGWRFARRRAHLDGWTSSP